MLTQNQDKNRHQIQMFCMDDLVPQNHLLRLIDGAIDWSFIYDLVKEKYSPDFGRPSLDPVVLIKIPFIQYLYGIKGISAGIKRSYQQSGWKRHPRCISFRGKTLYYGSGAENAEDRKQCPEDFHPEERCRNVGKTESQSGGDEEYFGKRLS